MILTKLAGPIIGAIIGYFTNYIAVKMLFRPLKPVMIGNFQLPFTPGIIPRGRKRLAKALGEAVGGTLLTPDDIEQMLLTDEIKDKISGQVINYLETETRSITEIATTSIGQEKYVQTTDAVKEKITDKVLEGIQKVDVGQIIAVQGVNAVREAIAGTMMAMFVSDDLINSFVDPIKQRINNYIDINGQEMVGGLVNDETDKFLENTPKQLLESVEIEQSQMKQVVDSAYSKVITSQVSILLQQANIPAVVESKVNEMDIMDIEELVMSVMKKELNSIVNLGALIGFVIGLLNLLF